MKNKEIQRQRFYDNNIPFDDIDPEMIDIIDVLNFKCDYKTQYCCYGHREDLHQRFYIMFDNCVSDSKILKLINYLHEEFDREDTYNITGFFTKEARYVDHNSTVETWGKGFPRDIKLEINWIWEKDFYNDITVAKKKDFVNKILKCLQDFEV